MMPATLPTIRPERGDWLPRYGSALTGVLLATLMRAWLHPLLGNQYPFPTFFVASMVTAWYAGLGPALLSLTLGCLAGIHYFVPPTTPWAAILLGTSIFAFVALTNAVLSESLRRARHAAERAQQAVKHQAEQLRAANRETAAINEQLQRRRDELQQLNEQLQEEREQKDRFLAILGHELRNPLSILSNALHLLEQSPGDPVLTRRWELMQRQVRQLTRLSEDLLDVTRISQGRVLLCAERLDLGQLLRESIEDCRGLCEEAGLTLALELPEEAVWVEGDPARLAQVIGNLLRNAAKFTDRGGRVTVALSAESSELFNTNTPRRAPGRHEEEHTKGDALGKAGELPEPPSAAVSLQSPFVSSGCPPGRIRVNSGRAVIRVRDTGIGIAPELLPHVFDPFAQGEQSRDRSRGGLGLGLALVKGLVALHGGEVTAASDGTGHGTEVRVRLPCVTEAPRG
jgi:signal transduction histidine kinase